ncbi:MAG: glycosyltransferase [Candidatus Pacebacteria bacterium]|nr:glycosyltransferase [Candidatus Paceibacterota bacterium]
MKVALLHDYLNQYGGAERVLEVFCEIFPDAPIYTLFYDEAKTLGRFKGKVKKTSFLDKKFISKNHRTFIPLMPLASSLMKIGKDYDVILSSSAGYGKGFNYGSDAKHVSYCHTPLRYAWEHEKYFNWHPIFKIAATPAFWYLRSWDYGAGQKPDSFFANSEYIAGKIKNYYNRNSEVLYPPVDSKVFYRDKKIKKKGLPGQGYFLAAGRMMHYKRFDIIVEAFNKLDLPLVIVGGGPELDRLKKMAISPKIKFVPFVSENELRNFYNEAEAFIFPQIEDFGLVAAEAQACGTPVIAFSQGGAREIVEDGVTGMFFDSQTPEALAAAVKKFLTMKFDAKKIEKSAQRFSKEKFKKRILEAVNF